MRWVLLSAALVVAGCGGSGNGSGGSVMDCSPTDIAKNESKFIGKTVNLTGAAKTVKDGKAMFTEGGAKIFATVDPPLTPGTTYTIRGVLKKVPSGPGYYLEIENAKAVTGSY